MPLNKTIDAQDVQRSLGERIRGLRATQGWSQEQFAAVCGLHRTYMGHVERGEKNVSLATLLRVANALGLRLSELFGRVAAGARIAKPALLRAPSSPGASELKNIFGELRAQRLALKNAIRELKDLFRRVSRR